ncbi:hypothetical protein J6590_097013 [Homalodisca vitripennis]|nr:hypothetical protein J6590_097013 [Homalodisca vitripennis]
MAYPAIFNGRQIQTGDVDKLTIYVVHLVNMNGRQLKSMNVDQGLYKVWFEGVTPCGSGLDSLVDVSSIKASHYNRTTLTIQGNLNMLQTVDEKTKMRLIAFSKNSHGTWTKSMVDTNVVTVCEFIKTDDYFWPAFVKISDVPAACPLNKQPRKPSSEIHACKTDLATRKGCVEIELQMLGEYHFQDASLTLKRLPPMVPKGCYKMVLNLWTDTLKSCNNIFVKVTGPKELPKPRCTS